MKAPKKKLRPDSARTAESAVTDSISDRDLRRLKHVEFFNQSYGSFYLTKMEKDKSILTLSVAGIGFSLALLGTKQNVGILHVSLFLLASISYLISIHSILDIFGKNAEYIKNMLSDKDVSLIEYKLKNLDKRAINFFYFAIILTIILGLSILTNILEILANPGGLT